MNNLALWLLTHLCAAHVTGDILERFAEGRSSEWLWRQVLVSIIVGVTSEWKLHWTDIVVATVGTALVGVQWDFFVQSSSFKLISPFDAVMMWGGGLPWPFDGVFFAFGGEFVPSSTDFIKALMVFPLLALIAIMWRTFRPANLIPAYFVCAILFTLGDLPIIWWRATHHVLRQSPIGENQSIVFWMVLRAACFFATLLVAARIARLQPKVRLP